MNLRPYGGIVPVERGPMVMNHLITDWGGVIPGWVSGGVWPKLKRPIVLAPVDPNALLVRNILDRTSPA
ncbi:MAG TPA: hypothetical protein VFA04_00960 [Bryobacteraceae bacterium]|nr:hypothetical protein [Bryobacteraceae bacterium]